MVLPVTAHLRREQRRGAGEGGGGRGGNATDHDNIVRFPPAVWDKSYDLFISSHSGFRQFSLLN